MVGALILFSYGQEKLKWTRRDVLGLGETLFDWVTDDDDDEMEKHVVLKGLELLQNRQLCRCSSPLPLGECRREALGRRQLLNAGTEQSRINHVISFLLDDE